VDDRLDRLQRAFADALLRGDEPVAEDAVGEAIAACFDEAVIDEHIVAPALRLVGDLWAEGQLGIADEHLATEISLRVIAVQREAFRVARRRSKHPIVLAAVEGEEHVVGLRMAGSLLLHAGFDVRMLGPNLPLHALAGAVMRHAPSVVGLTATMPGAAATLATTIDTIRAMRPDVGIVAGGAAVDHRFETTPGVAVCKHVGDLVGQVEALVQRAHAN
jgi:MerR family transcriptional regulator, light-induced transcriptional regulator